MNNTIPNLNLHELTHPQKRIWFTEKTFPGTSMATIGGIMSLEADDLDIGRLREAVRQLVRTSEALRLRFTEADGVPYQYVVSEYDVPVKEIDFTVGGEQEATLWMMRHFRIPFELMNSPLCSFHIGLLPGGKAKLLLKQHHLVSDGHSMVLTVNKIIDTYLALGRGETVDEAEEALPGYLEFLVNERQYEASPRFAKDRSFWLQKFAVLPEPTQLKPYDMYSASTDAGRYSYPLPAPLLQQLRQLCSELQTNLFTLFLAAFYIYVYKATGMEDLVVGTNFLNRTNAREKMTLGMFTSTTPIRLKVEAGMTFAEWVGLVGKEQASLIRHQRYPFDVLFTELKERDRGLDRLFHILMEYQVMDFVRRPGLTCEIDALFAGAEALDIAIHIKEHIGTGTLQLDFDYRSQVYTEHEMEQLCGRMLQLIRHAMADPGKPVRELSMVGERERQLVVHTFNDTARDYPQHRLIHEGFERNAAERPDHPAVVTDGAVITYRELNERANRIAHYLRRTGVEPGSYVGLMLSRSVDMIAAMIGIAKSGGAYVPMEPTTPKARIERIIDTLGVMHLLTEQTLNPLASALSAVCPALAHVLFVDAPGELLQEADIADLPAAAIATHTAYVIFTSGSTGVPKGVIIAHRTVSNLIDWVNRETGMGADDRVLFVTSPTFDLSVYDVFGMLTAGGTIRLAGAEDVRQPERLLQLLREEPITVWDSAPAALQQLAPLLLDAPLPAGGSLRLVMLSGDWIPLKLPGLLKEAYPGVRVLALGGATEATIWSNAFEVGEVQPDWASIPYGKPIQNARYYILDPGLQPCPIGVPGELYIGGDCLAVGYDDPQLTSARFVPDPFVTETAGQAAEPAASAAGQARMYRTGDRARWMQDGNIEFLGRIDHQVKIRGYRIELGEIQAGLARHPAIREAVVIDREDKGGDKYLCGYIVPEAENEELTVRELREFLAESLPDYMIPAHFVRMKAMPVTANGKLDRKALPEPDGSVGSGSEYVAPRNEIEAKLAGIWSEVLQRDVGAKDDFFKLGGHSLQATQMAARVRQQFGVDIPLRILFVHSVLEQVGQYIAEARSANFGVIPAAPAADLYPMSSAQKGIFVISQLEDTGTAYNMPGLFRIEGSVDLQALEQAIHRLIERHEALRTSFEWNDGEPVQRVHREVPFRLDISEQTAADVRKWAEAWIRPFDLSQAPLLRAVWTPTGPNESCLLFDMHHLVSDGVSMNILMNEIAELYELALRHTSGQPASPRLPELPVRYRDYAVWQQRELREGRMAEQEQYWQERFSGDIPVLHLPTDRPRPAVQSFQGAHVTFAAGPTLTNALTKLAEREGATLYMVLLAAYQALLAKYSGQADIVVGSPVAGRSHPSVERIVGMFVNMIPVRTFPSPDLTVTEYIQQVKTAAIEAIERQQFPFEEFVRRQQVQRDASRNPLFDTVFSLQNLDVDGMSFGGLSVRPEPLKGIAAKFDLLLEAYLGSEELSFTAEYGAALFDEATMRRFGGHYVQLLEQMAAHPERKLAELAILTEAEQEELLRFHADGRVEADELRTLQDWFEEQVTLTPERIAVVHEEKRLTYRELNEKANRLARTLRRLGAGPDRLIAFMAHRSIDMVVGMMAILKSGSAYVPIDPNAPQERIRYILGDCGALLLLAGEGIEAPADAPCSVLRMDDNGLYDSDGTNLPAVCTPDHLAYVIYTSGTTGLPKGTLIPHAGVGRIVKQTNYVRFTEDDRVLQLSNYAFDGSIIDLFGALLNGAQLVIIDYETATDISLLAQCIIDKGITVFFATTSLFNAIIDERPDCLAGVRYMLFGGEKASVHHVRKALKLLGPGRLINGYGPTETTVFATAYVVDSLAEDAVSLPIGRPMRGTRLYVTDPFGKLQPIGVPGELCIAGSGLARGYLHRPELTAEKFVPCPFEPGERMYRTGDLVKWLPDGTIEYIDRLDQQVKVRGFRIELGEIEHRLQELEPVQDAVVTAMKDTNGSMQLCAYLVSDRPWTVAEMRSQLARSLPDYMIPHYFVALDRIPLTPNGKLDRRALPEPDRSTSGAEFEAPANEIERLLASVWSSLLAVPEIGIHDHFFHLGGDSIKAIQASARLQKYGYKLGVRDFFSYPTIAELACRVQPLTAAAPQEPVTGEVVMGPVQRWFFERNFTDSHHFNQSVLLHRQSGWEEQALRQVLERLVVHHDALRMKVVESEGRLVQENRSIDEDELAQSFRFETAELPASVRDEPERLRQLADEQQAGLSLQEGPLVRAKLFHAADGDYLLIVIHHLVVDGVSWRILLEDLAEGYEQAVRGETVSFAAKTHSYQAWTKALEGYASSEQLQRELSYWMTSEAKAFASLPRDLPDTDAETDIVGLAQVCTVALSEQQTEQLLRKVHHAYHTETEDLLVAALALAVAEWTGDERVRIQLEGHGREPLFPQLDVSRTVGWFTSQYPVTLSLDRARHPLIAVKEQLRSVPHKGIGYGIWRYMGDTSADGRNSPESACEPEISFNYLGQIDQEGVSAFSIVRDPMGQQISPNAQRMHAIGINAIVQTGCLTVRFDYNPYRFQRATIVQLAERYKHHLLQLMEHCLTKKKSELTSSDVSSGEISQDDLEDLFSLLSE
ncbi:amino acid adenylation domain-containing protein [Paenibacillus chartarius]|uniref:Amino acid adenylation domain-containing protein n=1 Tax=Paenibacillus chartarius TaxID=747481 RepID=A0ABV6DQV2_9BACL